MLPALSLRPRSHPRVTASTGRPYHPHQPPETNTHTHIRRPHKHQYTHTTTHQHTRVHIHRHEQQTTHRLGQTDTKRATLEPQVRNERPRNHEYMYEAKQKLILDMGSPHRLLPCVSSPQPPCSLIRPIDPLCNAILTRTLSSQAFYQGSSCSCRSPQRPRHKQRRAMLAYARTHPARQTSKEGPPCGLLSGGPPRTPTANA